VEGTSSGSCPFVGFGIICHVEATGFITRVSYNSTSWVLVVRS
jgi:hypothetical protein